MIYQPLAFQEKFKVELDGDLLKVVTESDLLLHARVGESTIDVLSENAGDRLPLLLDVGLEHLFGLHHGLHQVQVLGKENHRSEFFQYPHLWTKKTDLRVGVERWVETKGVSHPLRERPADGVFYKKFIPQIGKTLTLRLITEDDLDTFHEWHNQPRVAHFWELKKSREELLDYVRTGLRDPHQFPVIVEVDGEKVGYYEFYWVKEDRLGPYYESEAFDRGFHFLIGNKNFLGFAKTDSIIKTVLHFLFLDDPRTRRIMAEPRHDNQKVLRYAEAAIGWKKLKEFDFPHKRAALLECRRELFFGGHAL